ncbi:acetyl-CoA carboxylase biotin carboxylase subunit family protein [Chitinibacter sp. ZOR0017]|uniref:ATP-grasp domain-containing protein n=1 Tax=Chitinibacter sp. ZOR0017 TaxID=1339254 RepID=UPI000647F80C|nr:ATP-grasp domain-containing protein [Chitinibacter sp. ZOR0017]
MNYLVLGRPQDCVDHHEWCLKNGHNVEYIEPDQIRFDKLSIYNDIVSFNDGYQVEVERLRQIAGLPGRGEDAIKIFTDKSLFKNDKNISKYCIKFAEFSPDISAQAAIDEVLKTLKFPVVIKPSNGFYSAGVVRADDLATFKRAYTQARRMCTTLADRSTPAKIIVETYLDGKEFAIDGFVINNVVIPLIIHKKFPHLSGPTFHEVAYITESFDRTKGANSFSILKDIIECTGLNNTPFHAEFRFDSNGKLYILEIAPRLAGGGATTQNLLGICTGLDAYELLHSLGTSDPILEAKFSFFGMEYDFAVAKSGALVNVDFIANECKKLGAVNVVQRRKNGDFVIGPPSNVDAILTAFFKANSMQDSLDLFNHISNKLKVDTE